jgi:hypothetical protein
MKFIDWVSRLGGPSLLSSRPFYSFIFSKTNPKILENPSPLNFYKNTPGLFLNYILVPAILHLGPYLTFYNYN